VAAPLCSLRFAPGSVVEVIDSIFDYNERAHFDRHTTSYHDFSQ